MKNYRIKGFSGWKRQRGMTLMELLVAGTISVIVSSGMVILMANTLGTGTQTIKMTKLSAEMRSAMQIMTRELRRANYHSTFASCFGDVNCLSTLGITDDISEIYINSDNDCFAFKYDRPRCYGTGCTEELVGEETVASFRRVETDPGGIGIIQMTTSGTSATNCPTTGWVAITNPDLVDIAAFNVTDAVANFESYGFPSADPPNSYPCSVSGTQSVGRIGITMTGKLKDDASLPTWMQGNSAPELTIRDFIRIRNNIVCP